MVSDSQSDKEQRSLLGDGVYSWIWEVKILIHQGFVNLGQKVKNSGFEITTEMGTPYIENIDWGLVLTLQLLLSVMYLMNVCILESAASKVGFRVRRHLPLLN